MDMRAYRSITMRLTSRRAEVHQQTEMPTGSAEVIHTLRAVCAFERPDGLQPDQNGIFRQQIGEVFATAIPS